VGRRVGGGTSRLDRKHSIRRSNGLGRDGAIQLNFATARLAGEIRIPVEGG
jgi:hypothetical protein